MYIDCGKIAIRDFMKKDVAEIRKIVKEKEMLRFMGDWYRNSLVPGRLEGYVDWLYKKRDKIDVYEENRFAVVDIESDELLGMVGMGPCDTLNEVEVAYFMRESERRKGYTSLAVNALCDWCFKNSDLKYLILTIDCANVASIKTGEKCGFEMFEKRTPIGHTQPNIKSDSYYYLRRYRK